MKSMWVLGPKGSQYFLDAIPSSITVGVGTPVGLDQEMPVMVVEYGTADLYVMATLAEQMEKSGAEPVIHLWNLEHQEPEVALTLELRSSSAAFFRKMRAINLLDPIREEMKIKDCTRVLAGAGANGHQEYVRKFIACFQKTKVAAIMLCRTVRPGDIHYAEAASLSTRSVRLQPLDFNALR